MSYLISNKRIPAISWFIVALLIVTSYARNTYWSDEISLWRDVVKKSPAKIRGYMRLGVAFYQDERPDQAIEQYRKALVIDPHNADFFNDLGLAYEKKRDFDAAMDTYTKAIMLKPDFADAYCNRGLLLVNRGDVYAGIQDLDHAIAANPRSKAAHGNRAVAYFLLGKTMDAMRDFETVVAIDPDRAAYSNLGKALLQTGQYERAAEFFTKAILSDPGRADAYANRGMAYLYSGNQPKAVADFKKACGLGDNNACTELRSIAANPSLDARRKKACFFRPRPLDRAAASPPSCFHPKAHL